MENMDIKDDLHRRSVPASARRHDCNDGWLNTWLIILDYTLFDRLSFAGIYAHCGNSYGATSVAEVERVRDTSRDMMLALKTRLGEHFCHLLVLGWFLKDSVFKTCNGSGWRQRGCLVRLGGWGPLHRVLIRQMVSHHSLRLGLLKCCLNVHLEKNQI